MPISVHHKRQRKNEKIHAGQPWNQHGGPRTWIVSGAFLCLSQGSQSGSSLTSSHCSSERQANTSARQQIQLSFYTPEMQSHTRVLRKYFFSSQAFTLHRYNSLYYSSMDKRPSKKPRLATDDLPSSKDMEKSLNRSLAKRGSGSRPKVQTAPLTEEAVAPVEAPASVPAVDGASYVESPGANPAGSEHGVRYGGRLVTRFNSSSVNDLEADAQSEYRYQRSQPAQPAVYAGPYTTAYPYA
jgi:hypothetical protein